MRPREQALLPGGVRGGRCSATWPCLLLACGSGFAAARGSWQQALVNDCIGGCSDGTDDQGAYQSLLQFSAALVPGDAAAGPPPKRAALISSRGGGSSISNSSRSSIARAAYAQRNLVGSLTFVAEDERPISELGEALPPWAVPPQPDTSSIREQSEKVALPVAAVCLGAILVIAGQQLVGLILIYFGAQCGMSLYMKILFSDTVISQELELLGIPAPFLVTGAQQIVAFFIIAPVAVTSARWSPRGEGAVSDKLLKIPQGREWFAVLAFSLFFAANIGMNNASLSLIAVSLNLIIRSCLPLVTLATTVLVRRFVDVGDQGDSTTRTEVCLMAIGVVCAGLATYASAQSSAKKSPSDTSAYIWGILVCFLSTFAGALNLIVTRFLGSGMKMNPMEAVTYTSLPCALFLLLPSLCMPHPTAWPGYSPATDWQIFQKVLEVSPKTLGWILVSGSFAAGYNLLQYLMVNYLTATHTAFCGNFNKAATIALSLATGLEVLPGGSWSTLMVVAIAGNIMSFGAYSYVKVSASAK